MKQQERISMPVDLAIDIAGLLKQANLQGTLDGSNAERGTICVIVSYDPDIAVHSKVIDKVQEIIEFYRSYIGGQRVEEEEY